MATTTTYVTRDEREEKRMLDAIARIEQAVTDAWAAYGRAENGTEELEELAVMVEQLNATLTPGRSKRFHRRVRLAMKVQGR